MAPTETAKRAAQPDATNNDAIALSMHLLSLCMFANFEITRPTAWHCNVWWLQTCRGRVRAGANTTFPSCLRADYVRKTAIVGP
jgi:hypothetical protein